LSDERKSDEAATSSDFRFSYIRDCPFADHFTVPAMLYDAGRESHIPDCDVPDILHIFLTLKIPARKVLENHLYANSVIAVQDDFSVLSDCFHD
jgi:hypothetical protein